METYNIEDNFFGEVINISNLFLSIFLSTILGVVLLFMQIPGIVIAFGIIAGSLFWGLSLLSDIHKRISTITEDPYKEERKRDSFLNSDLDND